MIFPCCSAAARLADLLPGQAAPLNALSCSSRVLAGFETVAAIDFLHSSRERFFAGGTWLTREYLHELLSRCVSEGALLGLFQPSTGDQLRGLVGYWLEPEDSFDQHGPTAFVPFALNSGPSDTFGFLAGLGALAAHLSRQAVPNIAFIAAEEDAARRRLYARFGSESGREERRGFQVIRYSSTTAALNELAKKLLSRRRTHSTNDRRAARLEFVDA